MRLAQVVPLTQRRLIDHGTVHSYGRLPSEELVSIAGGVDAPALARSEDLR